MGKASPLIGSFSGGELSPLMAARADFEKYSTGCQIAENFVLTIHGSAQRRIGTQLAGNAAQPGLGAWLVPFEANTDAGFVLEFTRGKLRYWCQRNNLLIAPGGAWKINDGSGDPLAETSTPWGSTNLLNTDGTLALQFTQSNDVMWIVNGSVFPQKLQRIAQFQFSMAPMGDGTHANHPFADQNINQSNTVYASATTGTVNLTCGTGAVFGQELLNTYFYLEQPAADSARPWEVGKAYVINDVVRSDGKNYKALNSATSGTVKPTHASGAKFDGKAGVQWLYTDQGYGIVYLTTIAADGKSAKGNVLEAFPVSCTSASAPSFRWAKAAWNSVDGFPTSVCLWNGRLCFARGSTLWTSVAGDFENFQQFDAGAVTADMAITETIGADRNDRIRWIANQGPLILGTASGEWSIDALSNSDPIGPGNIRAKPESSYGSRKIQPLRVSEALFFVQRGGRRLRETVFSWQMQGYTSADAAVLSQELVKGPAGWAQGGIMGLCFQREPDSVLWAVRADGVLLGFTYSSEHQVHGWHRHKLGGSIAASSPSLPGVSSLPYGFVWSCASIPGLDGATDDVYIAVSRTVGGTQTTYIEVLGSHVSLTSTGQYYYNDFPTTDEAIFLDACSRQTVRADGTIDAAAAVGLPLDCMIDGMYVGRFTPSSGVINVGAQFAGRQCWSGFPYTSTVRPMTINAGAQDGTSLGKKSKIQKLKVWLYNTVNFMHGPSLDQMTREIFAGSNAPMQSATPLFTGVKTVTYGGDWETGSAPFIVQDQPFPLTLLAIMPGMHIEDDG